MKNDLLLEAHTVFLGGDHSSLNTILVERDCEELFPLSAMG